MSIRSGYLIFFTAVLAVAAHDVEPFDFMCGVEEVSESLNRRFDFMHCVEEVSEAPNYPVVRPL